MEKSRLGKINSFIGSMAKGALTVTVLYFGAGMAPDNPSAIATMAAMPAKDLKQGFFMIYFVFH